MSLDPYIQQIPYDPENWEVVVPNPLGIGIDAHIRIDNGNLSITGIGPNLTEEAAIRFIDGINMAIRKARQERGEESHECYECGRVA